MKSKFKKLTAVILTVIMFVSVFMPVIASAENAEKKQLTQADFAPDGAYGYLTTSEVNPDEISNAVVIPGLFQSKTRLYNDDGTIALNEDGEEYEAPFFLDSTGDIVKLALKKALLPLLVTLITRVDFGEKLATAVADVLGEVLGGKIKSDSQGNLIKNVKADKYNTCVAELPQSDKDYIYDQIPLSDYANIVDEEHLYFYSYCSYGNLEATVDELYDFIKMAASKSPTGKVNIVPISQGGSLAVNLLERYPEAGQYLDRIVYIIPALNGTVLMGELYSKGFIDDTKSLFDEIFPVLLYDDDTPWMGYLVDVVLHLFSKKTVNSILDKGLDALIGALKNSTCIWGLVSSEEYLAAAEKYMSGSEDAYLKAQTDRHYQGQLNRYANIKKQMDEYGVEVFDIVDYNYRLYPLVDSWKNVNADGIIDVASTSMGATSFGNDVQLPDSYTPVDGGKYVDKYNIIDAGTGLLPDTTFYFHNQNHESTARNDIIMKLAISLLVDNNFTDINSYPEKYPQFNEYRDKKGFVNNIKNMRAFLETEEADNLDKEAIKAVIAEGAKAINNTTMTNDEARKYEIEYYNQINKLVYNKEPVEEKESVSDKLEKGLNDGATAFLKALSTLLYKLMLCK